MHQQSTRFFDGLPDIAPIDRHSRRGIHEVLHKAALQIDSLIENISFLDG
jgi:hypothetical protein